MLFLYESIQIQFASSIKGLQNAVWWYFPEKPKKIRTLGENS